MLLAAGLGVQLAGSAARAHENLEHRIADLTVALAVAPEHVESRIERARLYRLEARLTEALADLDRAVELAPNSRDVALERGLTLSALGRDARAEAELDRFLESGQPVPAALAERGNIRARSQRYDAAVADYSAAIELRPDLEIYLARGRLLETMGRLGAAAAGYRDALEVLGGGVVLRLALIRVETARGKFEAALELIDEQIARSTVKTEWHLRRADVLDAAGRAEEAGRAREAALAEANRVLRLRSSAIHLVSRARANLALGRVAAARRDLETALKRSPKLQQARELLEELGGQTESADRERR